MSELTELLLEVMRPKPSLTFQRPTLTYGPKGYSFNGSHFGNNEEAAKAARDAYYGNDSGIHADDWPTPNEPLTLDIELEPLEQ